MNRSGDAGSCAALATDLRTGARALRAAAVQQQAGASQGETPQGKTPQGTTPQAREAIEIAASMDALAEALTRFAHDLRDPVPPRSGRPHPHTALRTAALRITGTGQSPR